MLAASTLLDTWSKDEKALFCKVINKKIDKDNDTMKERVRFRFKEWLMNSKHTIKKTDGDDINRVINVLQTSTREHR